MSSCQSETMSPWTSVGMAGKRAFLPMGLPRRWNGSLEQLGAIFSTLERDTLEPGEERDSDLHTLTPQPQMTSVSHMHRSRDQGNESPCSHQHFADLGTSLLLLF